MTEFALLDRQVSGPRRPPTFGKVILSRLDRGESSIAAPAPSLKLIVEGDQTYQVDGRRVKVEPGQFLYLDAGENCHGVNRTFTTGLCLLLPVEQQSAEQQEAFSGWDEVLGRALVLSTNTSRLGRLLEWGAKAIASDPHSGDLIAKQLLNGVRDAVHEPLGESRQAIERLNAAKASTRRELYQRLERARGYMHANSARQVTLTELSGTAGLSQFHLARYFKMAFGKSPITYHRELRLERAARLLASQDCSLAEAANSAGYSDEVALSHAFKRHYGRAPKQWRGSGERSAA